MYQLPDAQRPQVTQSFMVLRLITLALCMGAFMFSAVATVVVLNETWTWQLGVIGLVGLAVGLSGLFASLVVFKFIHVQQIDRLKQRYLASDMAKPQTHAWTDEQLTSLLGKNQTMVIVRLALLEGGVFFNLIAFLIEHSYVSLGLGGVLILAMFSLFPRQNLIDWLLDPR